MLDSLRVVVGCTDYKERFVNRIYALPPVSTKQPLDSQRGYLAGVCMSASDRASRLPTSAVALLLPLALLEETGIHVG
jgi:hypothetical protein